MNEKISKPQHNSGDNQPDRRTDSTPPTEANREQQLVWTVSEALLQAVYDAVEHPSDAQPQTIAKLALALVHLTHSFDLTNDADKQELAARADLSTISLSNWSAPTTT
ncbi:hypothetical protein ACWIGW_01925 [Nocardia brasiliensis]